MSKYQFTELQQKLLDFFPKWEGDKYNFMEACNKALEKIDKMVGRFRGCTKSSDIGKLVFRCYAPMTELLAKDDTDWVSEDLSRAAVELKMANPAYGLGVKNIGEYEQKVSAEYKRAREDMGLGDDDIALEKAIEIAEELGLGYHRFLEKTGVEFTKELEEMQLVRHLKRAAAAIIVEDSLQSIIETFERTYLRPYELETDNYVPKSDEERELREFFKEMSRDYEERQQAIESLR